MRLWSLHPSHLDVKRLTGLWREALLAKAVLSGQTRGYRHHPQLNRFRSAPRPLDAINQYLTLVWDEAHRRGYNFNASKIGSFVSQTLTVTAGQLAYEAQHLQRKQPTFNPSSVQAASMFSIISGDIEAFERILAKGA